MYAQKTQKFIFWQLEFPVSDLRLAKKWDNISVSFNF